MGERVVNRDLQGSGKPTGFGGVSQEQGSQRVTGLRRQQVHLGEAGSQEVGSDPRPTIPVSMTSWGSDSLPQPHDLSQFDRFPGHCSGGEYHSQGSADHGPHGLPKAGD